MNTHVPDVAIGRRLAVLRERRGLTQGAVARLAGMAPSYLSRIERGKVHPNFQTVWHVLWALHGELSDIGGGEPEPQPARHGRGCPVTPHGACLLDSMRPEAETMRDPSHATYSPREVRVLRAVAAWMKHASPESVRALEVLVEALGEKGH